MFNPKAEIDIQNIYSVRNENEQWTRSPLLIFYLTASDVL